MSYRLKTPTLLQHKELVTRPKPLRSAKLPKVLKSWLNQVDRVFSTPVINPAIKYRLLSHRVQIFPRFFTIGNLKIAALGKVDLIGSGGSIYVKPSVVAQVRGFLSRTVAPGTGVLGVAVWSKSSFQMFHVSNIGLSSSMKKVVMQVTRIWNSIFTPNKKHSTVTGLSGVTHARVLLFWAFLKTVSTRIYHFSISNLVHTYCYFWSKIIVRQTPGNVRLHGGGACPCCVFYLKQIHNFMRTLPASQIRWISTISVTEFSLIYLRYRYTRIWECWTG